jgi:hypothetical protein
MGLGGLEVTILIHLLMWVPTEIPKARMLFGIHYFKIRVQCMDSCAMYGLFDPHPLLIFLLFSWR